MTALLVGLGLIGLGCILFGIAGWWAFRKEDPDE